MWDDHCISFSAFDDGKVVEAVKLKREAVGLLRGWFGSPDPIWRDFAVQKWSARSKDISGKRYLYIIRGPPFHSNTDPIEFKKKSLKTRYPVSFHTHLQSYSCSSAREKEFSFSCGNGQEKVKNLQGFWSWIQAGCNPGEGPHTLQKTERGEDKRSGQKATQQSVEVLETNDLAGYMCAVGALPGK